MSNERLIIIILWAVPCLGFLIYLFLQNFFGKETNIQSEKYNGLIGLLGILFFVISLTIPFIFKIEKYSDAIIISAIINGMIAYIHNLFKMKANNDKKFQEVNENLKSLEAALEKTNGDYRDILCNPAYAFKANKKFSEKLKNESYRVTSYYYEKQDTLEDRLLGNFPDSGTTVDQETAELLLSTSSKKSISALEQFSRGEMFLRIKLFKEFWEEAVQSSSSYLSICDLSIYSGKDESEIGSEKVNWERRIKDEIKALTEGKTKKFDKIILCEGASGSHDENFILKAVKAAWIKEIEKLKSAGIKSHYAEDEDNNMIWMACHDKFSDKISAINGSRVRGEINSNDLGTFGDDLIGEEFKVSKEPKLSKGTTSEGWRETEFLYRINANTAIVEQVRSTITTMITDGEIESLA